MSNKKFITTMIIETDYDPAEAGNVELIMDLVNGGANLKSRTTVEVTDTENTEQSRQQKGT